MPIITMPDGARVRFPDNMSEEQIRSMIAKKFSNFRAPFDPEGEGYDYESALRAGLGPDATGHWPSRDPKTGQILKGQRHHSYQLTREGEEKAGNAITKGEGGRYFSNRDVGGTAKQIARGAVQGALLDPVEGIGQIIEWAAGRKIPIPQSVRNWFNEVKENTEATGTGTAARFGGAVAGALLPVGLAGQVAGRVGQAGQVVGQAARARGVVPTLGELRAASTARAGTQAQEGLPLLEAYAARLGKSSLKLTDAEKKAALAGELPAAAPSRAARIAGQTATGAGVAAAQPVADPNSEDFLARKAMQALTGGALGGLAGSRIGEIGTRFARHHPWYTGAAVFHPSTMLPSLAILSGLAAQRALERAGPKVAGPLGAIPGQVLRGSREEEPDAESQ